MSSPRRIVWTSGMLVLLLTAWGLDAGAEPIRITRGSLELSGTSGSQTGTVSLVGATRGFTLSARVNTSEGVFQPSEQCQQLPACMPGAPIDLGANWAGLGVVSKVTLDGLTFTGVGSLTSDDSVAIEFIGSARAPAFGTGAAVLISPFQFEGQFGRALGGGVSLVGHGMATLILTQSFGPNELSPAAWRVTAARYEFSPTPEPATLVLTASGIAAVLLRRRRWSPGKTHS